jgi:hypothetical protein
MRLIGQAHTLVHQNGVVRVQTDIRAGTRYALFLCFPSCPVLSNSLLLVLGFDLIMVDYLCCGGRSVFNLTRDEC